MKYFKLFVSATDLEDVAELFGNKLIDADMRTCIELAFDETWSPPKDWINPRAKYFAVDLNGTGRTFWNKPVRESAFWKGERLQYLGKFEPDDWEDSLREVNCD